MESKADFSASFLQSSVSHDPTEIILKCGTGVFYQAMPAVGPDGKNVMKLIPVQKVNGQFYQTPFNIERDNMEQLKAFPKPVHSPDASSSQTQTRLPSLQPIADGRVVLKTLPEFRTLPNAIKSQPSGTNNFTIHNSKQVHVPLVTNSVSQYTVQLSPQTNGQGMTAVQTLPVTVKSPVLPNGHFLQIPPNAKVRTLPASALPPSIKCRIMNSVNNSSNLGKGPPTVVLVSPVNSVKLNSDQQMLLLTKPSQIQKTLSQISPANLQTPVCVPKTNEVNTPIKWVVQEGMGATAPYLIPLSTPNASSDSLKTVNHVNSFGTANEITANKATHTQASIEKITPGKDNALVMCNGKVYFVAKKNSEIAKDVMISEGGINAFVSTSPALPASSALGSNSSKRTSQKNISEIIDLCDDDQEASTCLGGAPGNLPTPSQTEVDESDEDSNVIFVSYIPPKSGEKVATSVSQNKCEEVQHTEINTKSVSLNEVEKMAHAEIEKDCVLFNPSAKTGDDKINVDEQVKENKMTESNLNCLSENVNMETDKYLESRSAPETRDQDDLSVAETVSVLEQPQNVETTDSAEKVIENPAPDQSRQTRSDCQLRKEFGITSNVLVCLQRTKPAVKPDQQTERLIINKRTLDGLRKVIQDSPLQSKIHQMMQVPYIKTEDDGLKIKKTKQEQDGNQDTHSPSTTNISPASKCPLVPMENSLVSQTCQEEVCSPTESSADTVHMQSEIAADCTGNTCRLTSSPKQKASETAEKQPFSPISARKTLPRSKKGKVCTACPCGTVLGVAEATSSFHPQEKPNPCTIVESQKGTRRICLNKTTVENHPPKDQDPVKKPRKKRLSRSPRKVTAPVESSTSESSHNISHNSLISSSSSNLLDCNSQTVLSSSGIKCDNVLSSHTDAETSQQDTSQVETASNNSIMPFSTKHPGPKIDNFPTEVLYSMEMLDAEEIKRQERIKRLKDLLKEKEAALERMQQSMNV